MSALDVVEQDAVWHVAINGASRGPLPKSQVLAELRNGTVGAAHLVWRPGFDQWRLLREVPELCGPPSLPQPQQMAPSPPLLPAADPATLVGAGSTERKWSLWTAASLGLCISSALLLVAALTREAYELATVGNAPSAEQISALIGRLGAPPLLFVAIAAVRNVVRRRKLQPSTVRAWPRVAAFLGILLVVGVSLRIFGVLYFSRDEIIQGDARDKFNKAFADGCYRSQSQWAVNSGFTDAQVRAFCSCVGDAVVSTITYRRFASDDRQFLMNAMAQAAPSCRAKT